MRQPSIRSLGVTTALYYTITDGFPLGQLGSSHVHTNQQKVTARTHNTLQSAGCFRDKDGRHYWDAYFGYRGTAEGATYAAACLASRRFFVQCRRMYILIAFHLPLSEVRFFYFSTFFSVRPREKGPVLKLSSSRRGFFIRHTYLRLVVRVNFVDARLAAEEF